MSKYVLDSSSIINIILSKRGKAVDILKQGLTASLVYYEIGNFLWRIKKEELADYLVKLLRLIETEDVGLNAEVLRLALSERLTYYDAVYLYLSKTHNLPLVSDDKELIKKGAVGSSGSSLP